MCSWRGGQLLAAAAPASVKPRAWARQASRQVVGRRQARANSTVSLETTGLAHIREHRAPSWYYILYYRKS